MGQRTGSIHIVLPPKHKMCARVFPFIRQKDLSRNLKYIERLPFHKYKTWKLRTDRPVAGSDLGSGVNETCLIRHWRGQVWIVALGNISGSFQWHKASRQSHLSCGIHQSRSSNSWPKDRTKTELEIPMQYKMHVCSWQRRNPQKGASILMKGHP